VPIPQGARIEDLKGKFLVPGFFDMHAHVTILFGTKDAQGYDPATSAAVLEKLLKLYYDRGVTLLTGSDLPNLWVIPGVSYHQELALLAEAGIPPLEILKMATHNGAEALGILAEVGTIEPGKQADLVVLQADPLADIHNTRRIEKVMQRGVRAHPLARAAAAK
jgi:imidazolonepropionase-like amidohydrolase